MSEPTLTLSDEELENLTRKKRPSAQRRALCLMGIEHRTRPDGSVAVLRAHVEAILAPELAKRRRRVPEFELR